MHGASAPVNVWWIRYHVKAFIAHVKQGFVAVFIELHEAHCATHSLPKDARLRIRQRHLLPCKQRMTALVVFRV